MVVLDQCPHPPPQEPQQALTSDILSMEESKPCQCPTSLQIPPDLSAPRVNMVGASPAGLHPVTLTDPGGLHLPQGPIQVIPNIATGNL